MLNSRQGRVEARPDYDAGLCGTIPLNFINLIQSHGILLVINKENLTIVQASENTDRILGLPASDVVKKNLKDFIGKEQLEGLQQKLQRREEGHHLPVNLSFALNGKEKAFSATVHTKGTSLLVELEEAGKENQKSTFVNIYQEISYVIAALKEAAGVKETEEVVVAELKKLSGFDRVMIYQFDESRNGTVMAEAKEEAMTPYLGLRFPASDVPKQARDLYFRAPYRLIPDVEARAVKLYPVINPLTNSLTDISECILRAVPMVHTEYLQNMKVAASMSVPIIAGNNLWGLISCHHRNAKEIDFELRSSFEIIAGVLSAQLSAREQEASFRFRSALHKTELKLAEQLHTSPYVADSLLRTPSYLMDLLGVEGVVLVLEDKYQTAGEVPDQKMVKSLVKWLNRHNKEKVFATDSLPRDFQEAEKYREVASGLIALQISAGRQYILGFRPELIKTVNWGGNPNEAVQMEEDGKRYHPRNSFKLWQEQLGFTSEPWAPEVLEVAHSIRTSVLEKLIKENENF